MPQTLFSEEELSSMLELPEVRVAKAQVDAKSHGYVSFSVAVTPAIRAVLEYLGLNLAIQSVPMRWIKGDTRPHIDTGARAFDTTHLVYMTDSPGEFVLGETVYPITKGTAYQFSEGVLHETRNTGTQPRLLLGPMSESGIAVGAAGIYGGGGTTLYIRQFEGSYEYSSNQTDWYGIPSFPCFVQNTNTEAGVLTIEFVTDITFTQIYQYFICGSSHIQFGSASLNTDGTRPQFTIDAVENYPGLIQNGYSDSPVSGYGYSNVYLYNLSVNAINGSTLLSEQFTAPIQSGGWIGQAFYGKAAINNYIINCHSAGDISDGAGGIVGSNAASITDAEGNPNSLTILGCSSSGAIGGGAGGIVGQFASFYTTNFVIRSCWSTGLIGVNGGGIAGGAASQVTITNCYSTGYIRPGAGGICGTQCGSSLFLGGTVTIANCYSEGAIDGIDAGGITGAGTTNTNISNCYSVGNISSGDNAGGICGNNTGGATVVTNCYTVGTADTTGFIFGGSATIPATCFAEADEGTPGSWSTTNANTVLTGTPSPIVGITWIAVNLNQPYELRNMGYTPYTTAVITGTPTLVRTYSQTIQAGAQSLSAVRTDLSGSIFTILQKEGGDSGSYASITINSSTGVISTSSATQAGTYTLTLRSLGSYNITEFLLTVEVQVNTVEIPCCLRPMDTIGADNTTQAEVKAGLAILGNFPSRRGLLSHGDLLRKNKVYSFKR